jgi:cyclopropane-fatty-acyl-phospholipid synthase
MNLIDLAETGFAPDWLVRVGIRQLLKQRLRSLPDSAVADPSRRVAEFAERLRNSPLAIATAAANEQHYEVPVEFYQHVLGPQLKYSACHFATADASLAEAEQAMLRLTCERAELEDHMHILELGCGWGSLTMWMAQEYPHSQITAVSNSASQREFIERTSLVRQLSNVQVITADMREFATEEKFDRVVSVEMFEHMRNYEMLFRRVSQWLTVDGKAFVHVFCHRTTPYRFETEGAGNWMGRHFFTGGTMPSADLFGHFADDLAIAQQWQVDGMHYWRTCEEWLRNLDANRATILARFAQDMSAKDARRQLQRWRMFFMACAELFRFEQGQEWFVTHYLFEHARRDVGIPANVGSGTNA